MAPDFLSLMLAMVMVFSLIPALERESSAVIYSENDDMALTAASKITMPIKIMDYESDGMFFDYLFGATGKDGHEDYVPESNYWTDFTNTLTSGKSAGNGIYYGSGLDHVHLASMGDYSNGGLSMNVSTTSLGGKQQLMINRTMSGNVPLMWNVLSFASTRTVKEVRYVTVVYLDYVRNFASGPPRIAMSSVFDDDLSIRYSKGNFSNWYYLDPNTVGHWGVEYAVIDLHDGGIGNGMALTKSVNDLYLHFPMGANDSQSFRLFAVGAFPNEGDARQFGVWAASAGSTANTDSSTYLRAGDTACTTIPKDSYSNENKGFSLLVPTRDNTFGAVSSIGDYIAARASSAGQQPLFFSGSDVDLSSAYDSPYSGTAMKWANNATSVKITTAIGYNLFQVIGDTQGNGYATVGLLESALDDNGHPVYKESVLDYVQTFLRNHLINCLDYDYDGWMYYSSIRGTPNGEIFGYTDGGQTDMDPTKAGVQGVPMDFSTAICEHWDIERHARYLDGVTNRNRGKVGSYEQTMAKREYLEGSWLECKQYIVTWWDLAYYMMHNFWVPNSYNQLQSDYNYLNLYRDTKTNHYVFDSSLTSSQTYPYPCAVTYDVPTKTIGHAGAVYTTYHDSYESYNPFTPVKAVDSDNTDYAGRCYSVNESNKPYYMDDGVNRNSGFGGELTYDNHNYGFSMVCNGEFEFEADGNLMFHFDGDDDVYLFINGELVMDLGGTHNNTSSTIYLDKYVTWAKTVLGNRQNYSLAEIQRAEKLNLQDGQVYSFDFFYMERSGTGANLRIETNINVVVPELSVEKKAYQDGVEVPDNGVVDNTRPIEYSFSLTNDSDTHKLYNITFDDTAYAPSYLGVSLSYDKGLSGVKDANGNLKWVHDKNGGTLEASDLVAYVDGYDGDPSRPGTKKLDTIEVTFKDNNALMAFLKDLTASGTQSGSGDGLYEGSGLWAFATLTIRGIYYTQTTTEQGNRSFVNKVKCTAKNGDYVLSGTDTHTVYRFGDPAYFQWANHKVIIDSEKIYHDLQNSLTYGGADFPQLGHMGLTLCDSLGMAKDYDYVKSIPGGNVYLELTYKDPGLHTFYLAIEDKSGVKDRFVVAVSVYVLDVQDSAVVLDYGLVADLSSGDGLYNSDVVNIAGKDILNTVIGITGYGGSASYVEQDVSKLHTMPNTANKVTQISGTTKTVYGAKLETPISLRHDMPWVIEWKTTGKHSGGLMFSMSADSYKQDNVYLFTSAGGFVSLGYYSGRFVNLAARPSDIGLSMNDGHTYRLRNVISSDENTNMVYLQVDGKDVGPLNQYYLGGTYQNTTNNGLNGMDFTFNYMGPTYNGTNDHRINLTNFEYINVWEGGVELNNYRWELNSAGTSIAAVATGEPGNVINNASQKTSDSTTNRDIIFNDDGTQTIVTGTAANGKYYAMARTVQLASAKEWAVEFKYEGLDANMDPSGGSEEIMIFSSLGTSMDNGHEYLYLRADIGLVAFGRRDSVGHHNYGIGLKEIYNPDFDTSTAHVYRLENRIKGDGTNMVYLIVDGVEVGAMEYYYKAGGYISSGQDFFTDNDFAFTHIGNSVGQWPIEGKLHYLQVWEDTALHGIFGWKKSSSGLLVDAAVTDTNGNRIEFASDSDGVLDYSDGYLTLDDGNLSFKPTQFMDETYQAKIAVAVHNRNFIPTPLSEKTVDVANEVQMFKNITILPATIVYYEDDFPALNYVGTKDTNFTVIGSGSDSLKQNANQDAPYGSDDVYNETPANTTGNSLHKIKIDHVGPLAHFNFTGTGFEIVARTNAVDSGILFVEVYDDGDVVFNTDGSIAYDISTGMVKVNNNASPVALIPVITEYDNNNDNGAEQVYTVPVITVDDLALGNYIAVITGVPTNSYDEQGNITDTFDTYLYLDGIRIIQPIGSSNQHYNDIEDGAIFTEIRNEILAGNVAAADCGEGIKIGAGLTTWTENHDTDAFGREYTGQEVSSIQDYLQLGPNNEVYMDGTFTKSGLIFLVKETNANAHSLQIAMRTIDYGAFIGAGHTFEAARVMYGYLDAGVMKWSELVTIYSAAEQYYEIPYTNCAKVGDYYMVVLQVTPYSTDIPAMVSFSSVKHKGLEFASVNDVLVNGIGTISGDEVIGIMNDQMSSMTIYTGNESVPGNNFAPSDKNDSSMPTLSPKYPTLAFQDEIRYNIYFTAQNLGSFTTADMGLITFNTKMTEGTIDDAMDVIPGAVYNGSEYMVHTNGIPARKMGDKVYFKVYAKLSDGSYVYSDMYSYSAVDYAEDILNGAYNNDIKALIVSMLNYGAAAQQFFGYKTDSLMNANLTVNQQAIVQDYDDSMIRDLPGVDSTKVANFVMTDSSYIRFNPAVSFTGAFAINFYFDPAYEVEGDMTFYYWTQSDYENVDVLSVDNASGKQTLSAVDGVYCATIGGIPARGIGDAYYVVGAYECGGVTYYTNVVTYSLGAYCEYLVANPSSAARSLASATAVYGYYAEGYFAD